MKEYALEIVRMIVVAAGGGAGIWAIIKQLANAATTRAEVKKTSESGHAETQKLLKEHVAVLQEENTRLRAEKLAADKKISRLEGERNAARAAVAALGEKKEG